jgi:hypothetical protein
LTFREKQIRNCKRNVLITLHFVQLLYQERIDHSHTLGIYR